MNVPFVDLKAQYKSIKEEVDVAMAQVFDGGQFIGGDALSQFEGDFSTFHNGSHCVGCANGTDAMEIALQALNVGPGDEVIAPAFTWVSTASAVSRVGATPILADVHPEFYTIDPQSIAEKITSRTKAILPVHFYGLPAPMQEILDIARQHGLKVLEDCAQGHAASIDGKLVGTFGDAAAFSFYPTKNLGAYGDGGAILSADAQVAETARVIAMSGQRKKNDHVAIGRNSRLDTLQAAVLSVKLKHLEKWTRARRQAAAWYAEDLRETSLMLPVIPAGYGHAFHLYVIQTGRRDALMNFLSSKGIVTQIHYPKALHQLGLFSTDSGFPVANTMSERILSLPMYAELTREQVSYVTASIREFLSE